jgi:DNA mismatch repair ATPase MutS
VNLLDARLNVFFAFTLGPALLWDLNLVLRAERFRLTTGQKLRAWIEAIGEVEALASLGSYAYERPDYAMPTVSDGGSHFRALALAHPLIDRTKVVANDLNLGGPGFVLLLSGSNMSGKSTLLRSVGINVVLARAGAPVAARALEVGVMKLLTSVRIVDSLAAGTSHFYAEIKRLKAIVDAAKSDPDGRVLYLLDEMLHGTNSRERYIGARSVIRFLAEHRTMGIVTTHDLALAKIAGELPAGSATNMHFSDEVDNGEIRFDYRLREGPVASTNALRLMRSIGIDVSQE